MRSPYRVAQLNAEEGIALAREEIARLEARVEELEALVEKLSGHCAQCGKTLTDGNGLWCNECENGYCTECCPQSDSGCSMICPDCNNLIYKLCVDCGKPMDPDWDEDHCLGCDQRREYNAANEEEAKK